MENKWFFLEKNMRLQIREILSNYKLKIALFATLSVVHIVAVFAVPLISGYLVDNVLQEKNTEKVILGVTLSFVIVLLSPLSNLLRNKVSVNLSLEITKNIRIQMFDKIIDASMEELDKSKKGAILSKFINDSIC